MNFSNKLRNLRKNEELSQEQLAEKIGVSRQAVTKWETGKGLPDIENMIAIAEIFKTTLDELISDSKSGNTQPAIYTSETIYDIDCEKHFDMSLGCAKAIVLSTGTDEKLHICLKSEILNDLSNTFKIKLDTNKNKLDVNYVHKNNISRYKAAESVIISIVLPSKFAEHCEISATVKLLQIKKLNIKRLEFDGDADNIIILSSNGSIELTSKTNYDITVEHLIGQLDINQWHSKAIVHISEEHCPKIVNNGKKCEIYILKKNEIVKSEVYNKNENELSVSGIGSELVVDLR